MKNFIALLGIALAFTVTAGSMLHTPSGGSDDVPGFSCSIEAHQSLSSRIGRTMDPPDCTLVTPVNVEPIWELHSNSNYLCEQLNSIKLQKMKRTLFDRKVAS